MAKQSTKTLFSSSLLFTVMMITISLLLVNAQLSSAARLAVNPNAGVLLPCNSDVAVATMMRRGTKFQALRHCNGKLLLAKFPKGKLVPPSGPSRRTNDNNN